MTFGQNRVGQGLTAGQTSREQNDYRGDPPTPGHTHFCNRAQPYIPPYPIRYSFDVFWLALKSKLWFACVVTTPNPLTSDLAAGDVVVYAPGDARTVRALRPTDSTLYVTVTWTDGRTSLCDTQRAWVRLHPLPKPTPEPKER